jgi:peptidoglycan/LPS O-acetylase OafA/YrhL
VFLFQNGTYGVTAFFVVSGFLITQMLVGPLQDLEDLDLKKFYVKRAARILPLLLLVLGITLAGTLLPWTQDPARKDPFWSGPGGLTFSFWGSLTTFTFNWFLLLKKPLWQIGIQWALLWSLAVEEQFYFFYPLVVRWTRTRRRLAVLLGWVVLSSLLFRLGIFLWAPERLDASYIASFSAFDQLAIGSATFLTLEKIRAQQSFERFPGGIFAILGLVFFAIVYLETSVPNAAHNVLAPTFLAVGCGVFILGGVNSGLERSPFLRFLSFPGRLSYGLYLWHSLILVAFWPWVLEAGLWAGPFLFVLLVYLGAEASYRSFEVPANRLIREIFGFPPSRSL